MPQDRPAAWLILKGIVFFIVLGKVQRLGFCGNPFCGIVLEFPAGIILSDNTLLGAKDKLVVDFCSVHAIRAGALNFLSKQHMDPSFSLFSILYTLMRGISSVIFPKNENNHDNRTANDTKQAEGRVN